MSEIKNITTPLTEDVVRNLRAGDFVRITGPIYTARDAAHKRMYERCSAGSRCPSTCGTRSLLRGSHAGQTGRNRGQRRPDDERPHGQVHAGHD